MLRPSAEGLPSVPVTADALLDEIPFVERVWHRLLRGKLSRESAPRAGVEAFAFAKFPDRDENQGVRPEAAARVIVAQWEEIEWKAASPMARRVERGSLVAGCIDASSSLL